MGILFVAAFLNRLPKKLKPAPAPDTLFNIKKTNDIIWTVVEQIVSNVLFMNIEKYNVDTKLMI